MSKTSARASAGHGAKTGRTLRDGALDLREPSLRAVFLRRMRNWTRDLASSAPASALAEALAQPNARSTMVHLLAAVPPSAEESEATKLRERAIERALVVREELRQAAGGFRSTAWVAEHLNLRRQSVDKRRREGKLLALEGPHGYEFPACQFAAEGTVDGLEAVLAAVDGETFWETLAALVTPAPALGGRSVVQAMAEMDDGAELKCIVANAAMQKDG
jgi:hypothetical protein